MFKGMWWKRWLTGSTSGGLPKSKMQAEGVPITSKARGSRHSQYFARHMRTRQHMYTHKASTLQLPPCGPNFILLHKTRDAKDTQVRRPASESKSLLLVLSGCRVRDLRLYGPNGVCHNLRTDTPYQDKSNLSWANKFLDRMPMRERKMTRTGPVNHQVALLRAEEVRRRKQRPLLAIRLQHMLNKNSLLP